jgi:hypothetical protein
VFKAAEPALGDLRVEAPADSAAAVNAAAAAMTAAAGPSPSSLVAPMTSWASFCKAADVSVYCSRINAFEFLKGAFNGSSPWPVDDPVTSVLVANNVACRQLESTVAEVVRKNNTLLQEMAFGLFGASLIHNK